MTWIEDDIYLETVNIVQYYGLPVSQLWEQMFDQSFKFHDGQRSTETGTVTRRAW